MLETRALEAIKAHISGYMEDDPGRSVVVLQADGEGFLADIWATEWADVVGVRVDKVGGRWEVEILGEGMIQIQPTPEQWAAIYAMPDLELDAVALGNKMVTKRTYDALNIKEPPFGGSITSYGYGDGDIELNCPECEQYSYSPLDLTSMTFDCSECGFSFDCADFLNSHEMRAFKDGTLLVTH